MHKMEFDYYSAMLERLLTVYIKNPRFEFRGQQAIFICGIFSLDYSGYKI